MYIFNGSISLISDSISENTGILINSDNNDKLIKSSSLIIDFIVSINLFSISILGLFINLWEIIVLYIPLIVSYLVNKSV